ncbi:NDMA-dependent alcohol dehydrogenase [Modestobacter sp. NPDC049651]|uniref:NDMA-dependent alcohol dehydrogenase n=1 Tax=unclassified Modestobacter TaxID=2643866 RepID=UPI0033E502ED
MPVPTRGAVLRSAPGKWEVTDLLADDPQVGEIQVKLAVAGLCHSDDHIATGDMPQGHYPIVGGHEGAGVVTAVGPGVRDIAEGDHVVFSFLPACGRCRWCATGKQYLCDSGANIGIGSRWDDPESFRMGLTDGTRAGQMCGLGSFSELTTIDVRSAVKISPDVPMDVAALVSCGVGTGFGTATQAGAVEPGETVIVMGIGGIGINAVQGAAFAGASHVIAVDPVPFKQEKAREFGATHAFGDIAEAADFARSVTNGQGADKALVTVGVTTGEHVAQALNAVRKAGVVVVTGLGPVSAVGLPISSMDFTLFGKEIKGALFGDQNPTTDIPRMIRLWQEGHLKLDGLITNRYSLDDINTGYEDMHAGKNIRGVLAFD